MAEHMPTHEYVKCLTGWLCVCGRVEVDSIHSRRIHEYVSDRHSGAGNCECGWPLGNVRHLHEYRKAAYSTDERCICGESLSHTAHRIGTTDPLEEDVQSVDEVVNALERGFTPGRWWQCNNMNGELQAETSDPREFESLGLLDRDDVAFYQQYIRTDIEWVRTDPPRKE